MMTLSALAPQFESWSDAKLYAALMVRHGQQTCQAFSAFQARERARHFARADGWQHVLQIETDSEVGPWIGEGCLYACIRKSDLTERRFDRCWTMPQCT